MARASVEASLVEERSVAEVPLDGDIESRFCVRLRCETVEVDVVIASFVMLRIREMGNYVIGELPYK